MRFLLIIIFLIFLSIPAVIRGLVEFDKATSRNFFSTSAYGDSWIPPKGVELTNMEYVYSPASFGQYYSINELHKDLVMNLLPEDVNNVILSRLPDGYRNFTNEELDYWKFDPSWYKEKLDSFNKNRVLDVCGNGIRVSFTYSNLNLPRRADDGLTGKEVNEREKAKATGWHYYLAMRLKRSDCKVAR